jgi:hypothetical protein
MGQKWNDTSVKKKKLWFWLLFLNYFMYICIERYKLSVDDNIRALFLLNKHYGFIRARRVL